MDLLAIRRRKRTFCTARRAALRKVAGCTRSSPVAGGEGVGPVKALESGMMLGAANMAGNYMSRDEVYREVAAVAGAGCARLQQRRPAFVPSSVGGGFGMARFAITANIGEFPVMDNNVREQNGHVVSSRLVRTQQREAPA